MTRLIAVGSLLGITWAAALRAWMMQLAGPDSQFSWDTFSALILPAAIAGGLLGLAEHRRRRALPVRRFLFAPLLPAVAPLLLPDAIPTLIHTGMGGGAIGVVGFGLAGAYGLAGHRPWLRWTLGLPAAGVAVAWFLLFGPVTNPRGLWAAVLLTSLYGCFSLACTIPLRNGIPDVSRQPSLVDSVHE